MPKALRFAVTFPSALMNGTALTPPAAPAVLAPPALTPPRLPAPPFAVEPPVLLCPPPVATGLRSPLGPFEEHAIEPSARSNQATRLFRGETFTDECTQEPPMREWTSPSRKKSES